MLRLEQAVVVEGKYDKIRLESVLDAVILTTDGFRIFRDREKLALIRAFARRAGIVLLTDSDAAGQQIRGYLSGCVPADRIIHVYLPPLAGKEPRKAKPGAAGLLGVEGYPEPMLRAAFARAGLTGCEIPAPKAAFSKPDFYRLGLTGAPGSAALRRRLLARMDLPEYLSCNGLLEVANRLYAPAEFLNLLEEVRADGGPHETKNPTALSD